ncbi:MAG: type II toxin-antitoxin system HicB family antitoxin [Chloroflexi bacterium]|nr:type II toxin-antitoxin system HicB family antitoxin [Chloroflexota bacterium]
MEQAFEATIEKRDKWYIGWVEAVPGAFSQGKTVKEVEENLREAVQLILESQQELRAKGVAGKILKRKILVEV